MQGTKNIRYQECGRRIAFVDGRGMSAPPTVSGWLQKRIDFDVSASGLNEEVLIGSGQSETGLWWVVDRNSKYFFSDVREQR
jgi:hypothetical protein